MAFTRRVNMDNPMLQEQMALAGKTRGGGLAAVPSAIRSRIVQQYAGAEGERLGRLDRAGLERKLSKGYLDIKKSENQMARDRLKDVKKGTLWSIPIQLATTGMAFRDSRATREAAATQELHNQRIAQDMYQDKLNRYGYAAAEGWRYQQDPSLGIIPMHGRRNIQFGGR